jgi:decaprenylphospho-beta-D-erythro-pentofuranosid-2-ulose 2-reductase
VKLLLIGGTSEIGLAIARRLRPSHTVLLGRNEERLAAAASGLEGEVETGVLDGDGAVGRAFAAAAGFDVVVLAIGVLGGQAGLDADTEEALDVMRVNFLDSGALMLQSLRDLRARGRGTLVVLSSVAAERPRASNPIYGAAKAGLDGLAQGLGDAISSSGVRVLVVRPGFVRTRMTAGLEAAPFATTPEAVAEAVAKGLNGNAHTVWVPARLRLVFAVLRHLPRPIWRKLAL